jgi:hypothetical protein
MDDRKKAQELLQVLPPSAPVLWQLQLVARVLKSNWSSFFPLMLALQGARYGFMILSAEVLEGSRTALAVVFDCVCR